jgi:phosphatidylglycerophosphate synthase
MVRLRHGVNVCVRWCDAMTALYLVLWIFVPGIHARVCMTWEMCDAIWHCVMRLHGAAATWCGCMCEMMWCHDRLVFCVMNICAWYPCPCMYDMGDVWCNMTLCDAAAWCCCDMVWMYVWDDVMSGAPCILCYEYLCLVSTPVYVWHGRRDDVWCNGMVLLRQCVSGMGACDVWVQ